MSSKSAEKLIRENLKLLRGDNISGSRLRRHKTISRAEDDGLFKKTKLFEFLSQKKLRNSGPEAGLILRKTFPAMSSHSLNYIVMQYLFNTKHKVGFDPVGALSHFVVPGVAESFCSEEKLVVEQHSEEGLVDDEIAKGKNTVSRGIGSSALADFRLEILKMRAARRPTDDGSKDNEQSEQGTPDL